jgi:hypothetical protein
MSETPITALYNDGQLTVGIHRPRNWFDPAWGTQSYDGRPGIGLSYFYAGPYDENVNDSKPQEFGICLAAEEALKLAHQLLNVTMPLVDGIITPPVTTEISTWIASRP